MVHIWTPPSPDTEVGLSICRQRYKVLVSLRTSRTIYQAETQPIEQCLKGRRQNVCIYDFSDAQAVVKALEACVFASKLPDITRTHIKGHPK